MGHASDLTGKAYLSDSNQIISDRGIPVGGRNSQSYRQVCTGLIQPQAANDIDIGIKNIQLHTCPFFGYSHQKDGAVEIKAVSRPAGNIEGGFCDQGLDLCQDGPGALHNTGNAGAAGSLRAAFQKHLGGIRDFYKTHIHHFEDTDFVGGTKAVLGGSKQTVRSIGIALKIQNTVYHVLQHLGTGDVSVFVDVANNEHGDALRFAELHHGHGAVLYLRHTSGRGIIFLIVQGLDGVYDQDIGLHFICGFQNIGQSGFG